MLLQLFCLICCLLQLSRVPSLPLTTSFPHKLKQASVNNLHVQESLGATSTVFTNGEHGYFCFKIPVLMSLFSGRVLAFAEARMGSCSDFAWTDLVMKISDDGGMHWSPLIVVRSETNSTTMTPTVIGNAAPVQLLHNHQVLLPHTLNNSQVWLMTTNDDGTTWSHPQLLDNVTQPDWKWVGTGPPGSLELQSGRILVPSYHSKVRGNLINNIVHGHVMLSDDHGRTWRLGQQLHGYGQGDHLVNENQAVQLRNGSILINARSFATLTPARRLQTISNDDGETFGPVSYVEELKQPFDGCQGSIIADNDNNRLYFTGPDSTYKRDHLTLWSSDDQGKSWDKILLLDSGPSGYSSLQLLNSTKSKITLGLLYEQSNESKLVMLPEKLIYRVLTLS